MLSYPSSEATSLTVSVDPVAPAVAGDFSLSSNNILTIAAGETTSTGTVTIAAVDNQFHSEDKMFTINSSVSGGNHLAAPNPITLIITDDDGLAEALLDQTNEQVLPSVLSKVVSHQVAAITGRLGAISSGALPSSLGGITMEGLATDIADYLISHRESLHRGSFTWDWKQALSGRDFSFSLPGVNLLQTADTMMDNSPSSLNFSLWGMIDYSSMKDQIDSTTLDGNILSGHIGIDTQLRDKFTSISAGAQLQLWRYGATAFALKLDGTTAHFLATDVQRGRLAAQLSHDFSPSSAGVLSTELELGLLMSTVDDSGAELAGSLHWHGTSGISAFGKSRVLLTGGVQKNWGISGGLRYTPSGGQEGLMVSLEPSLGSTTQQLLSNLWSESVADLGGATELGAQLRAELAYGFTTAAGLLRPYTMYSISEESSTIDAGVRYSLDGILDLDLRGSRRTSRGGTSESRVILELRTEL